MYLFAFHEKLKKLNDKLYIHIDRANITKYDQRLTGIYLREGKREHTYKKMEYHYMSSSQRDYFEAKERGLVDTYICGVPIEEIPEYDIYDLEADRLIVLGWRTIVLTLVKKGICSLEKARQLFSDSLGESDYDNLDFFGKMKFYRKIEESNGRNFRL